MASIKKHSGISSLWLLFVLATAGFLLLCFFRLGPAYLENHQVKGALKQLGQNHPNSLAEMSNGAIRQELSRYYTINNIRGEPARALEIERQRERILIKVAYEVRVPMFSNIDAVMSFNNVLDSSQPDKCCKPSDE